MPAVTTVYSWMKDDDDIKKDIMDARQLGAWSLIDQMNELLQTDVEPQKVQWQREKLHHFRWLASKLLVGTFGDKLQSEVKQDTNMTISWGVPADNKAG